MTAAAIRRSIVQEASKFIPGEATGSLSQGFPDIVEQKEWREARNRAEQLAYLQRQLITQEQLISHEQVMRLECAKLAAQYGAENPVQLAGDLWAFVRGA